MDYNKNSRERVFMGVLLLWLLVALIALLTTGDRKEDQDGFLKFISLAYLFALYYAFSLSAYIQQKQKNKK